MANSAVDPTTVKGAAPLVSRTSAPSTGSPPGTEAPPVVLVPAPRDEGIPVVAMLGYSSNDLELGLGVRAGKMMTSRIYLGGAFVYQLGHEVSSAAAGGYTAKASMSAFYIGPEVGYEFDVAPVRVRAYTGLGLMWFNASASVSGPGAPSTEAHSSTNKFVLWPGVIAHYPLPNSSFFIGGDLRFVTVPDGPAAGLFALLGTRF
jgi:hypothetical protein